MKPMQKSESCTLPVALLPMASAASLAETVNVTLLDELTHKFFQLGGIAMEAAQPLVTTLQPLLGNPICIGKPLRVPPVGNLATDRTLSKHTGLDTDKRGCAPLFSC